MSKIAPPHSLQGKEGEHVCMIHLSHEMTIYKS